MSKCHTFNDFKELRGVIFKEPEKKAAPVKCAKSPSGLSASDAEAVPESLVGRRVELMDSSERGVVKDYDDSGVTILLDNGLKVTAGRYDYALTDEAEERRLSESVSDAKGRKRREEGGIGSEASKNRNGSFPKWDFEQENGSYSSPIKVDLHIGALQGGDRVPEGDRLRFQLEVFHSVIREQMPHKGRKIMFIHGVGDGILARAIRSELDQRYAASCAYTVGDPAVTVVRIV